MTVVVREAGADERAWANRLYAAIDFASTAPDDVQLVAVRDGDRVGLGRLVACGGGAFELGGIWTAESARGEGIAAIVVRELLDRAGDHAVWCVPFRELADYYARFGFARRDDGWPAGVAAKADACAAKQQDVVVMRYEAPPEPDPRE